MTLTLKADGYKEQTVKLTVKEREKDLLDAPEFESISLTSDFLNGDYYRISFSGESEDIETYLKQVSESGIVSVNDVPYNYDRFYGGKTTSYKTGTDESYGRTVFLDFTVNGFKAGENSVKIVLKGYKDLEFTVVTAGAQESDFEIDTVSVIEDTPDANSKLDSSIDETETVDSDIEEIAEIEKVYDSKEASSDLSSDKL